MDIMRKVIPALTSGISYLLLASVVYAQVSFTDPAKINQNVKAENIPQLVINYLFYIGIFLAVGFLMYGGIRWITSGGDKAKVDAARKNIVAAIIGLVVVVGTFTILRVVFGILGVENNPFGGGGFSLPTLTNPQGGSN